jgi:hypothetical protein
MLALASEHEPVFRGLEGRRGVDLILLLPASHEMKYWNWSGCQGLCCDSHKDGTESPRKNECYAATRRDTRTGWLWRRDRNFQRAATSRVVKRRGICTRVRGKRCARLKTSGGVVAAAEGVGLAAGSNGERLRSKSQMAKPRLRRRMQLD